MLLFFLRACAKQEPPELFAALEPLPEPPIHVQPVDYGDACPTSVPLLPGHAMPYMVDGLAVCRAQVVPDARVLELLQGASDAEHWEKLAAISHQYRRADRAYAQASINSCRVELDYVSSELMISRASVPAGVVLGIIFGAGVGIAAAEVAP